MLPHPKVDYITEHYSPFTEPNWSVMLCHMLSKIVVFCRTLLGAERHRRWACQPLLFMLLLWDMDVTSAPHNHCNWLMCLFAGWMFGKIDLNLKNKRFAFSPRNIRTLCDLLITQTAIRKRKFLSEFMVWKNCPRCVTALRIEGCIHTSIQCQATLSLSTVYLDVLFGQESQLSRCMKLKLVWPFLQTTDKQKLYINVVTVWLRHRSHLVMVSKRSFFGIWMWLNHQKHNC